MKNYPLIWLLLALGLTARAQTPPPVAATQAEVNAGLVTRKYVSPATLAGWPGAGSGTSALTAAQATNLLNSVTNGDTRLITLNGVTTNAAGGIALTPPIQPGAQNIPFFNGYSLLGGDAYAIPSLQFNSYYSNHLSHAQTTNNGVLVLWPTATLFRFSSGYDVEANSFDADGQFNGSGAGLTGTAASLSIGGTAANVTALVLTNSVNTAGQVSASGTGTNNFPGTINAGQIISTNLFALGSSTNGYFVLYTNTGVIYAVWYQTNFPGGGGGLANPLTVNLDGGNHYASNFSSFISGNLTLQNGGLNFNGIAGVNGGDILYVDGSHSVVWNPGATTDGSHSAFEIAGAPYARILAGNSSGGSSVELNTAAANAWQSTGKLGATTGYLFGNTNGVTGTFNFPTNGTQTHGITLQFSGGILTSNLTF